MEISNNKNGKAPGADLKDIDFWESELASHEEQMKAMQNAYSLYSYYRQKCLDEIAKLTPDREEVES